MAIRVLQSSFTGGEISPAMYGRIDDKGYQTGLATCRNFITLPQGPVANRPGTEFVRAAKYADKKCRLIPFQFSADQTMVIELGDKYARFHTQGATLMSGDAPYEITTPYSAEDVMGIHYCQSGDIITLVHTKYAPRELRRYGATDWRLVTIDFSSGVASPAISSVAYSCGLSGDALTNSGLDKNRYTIRYKVTAIVESEDGDMESAASAEKTVTGNLYIDDSTCTITWGAVSGASRYRIYKSYTGVFGYIGETDGTTFLDDNISPDEGITPPRYDDLWQNDKDFPGAVAYFEQRRFFAGTTNRPQMLFATRPGTERDMSYTIPALEDNRLKFRINATQASRINHLVPIQALLVLTESSSFRVEDNVAADNIKVKPQTSEGASNVQPVIVNTTVVYVAARGGHLFELGYQYERGGFVAADISVRAGHLFETARPVDMARMVAPDPILWLPMSDGTLLGLTYMPDQGVGAWHKHDTVHGKFEAAACVTEGDEDMLYLVVQRDIGGKSVRYIERMHQRRYDDLVDAFYVDCGATYRGEETMVISGLNHLEGETVAVLADGGVQPQQVVTNGTIYLDAPASVVHIGLPITSEIETLPMVYAARDGSYGKGHTKNINSLWLQVYRSSGLFAGTSDADLVEIKQRQDEPYGEPPRLVSDELEVALPGDWSHLGKVVLWQEDPLPVQLVGITADLAS